VTDEATEPKVHSHIAYVDTETTSLSAETGKIWEFAGIRYDFLTPEEGKTKTEKYEVRVDTPFGRARETRMLLQIDQPLGEADQQALRIGRYFDRFGKNGYAGVFALDALKRQGHFPISGQVFEAGDAAWLVQRFLHDTSIFGNTINFDHERLERFLRWEGQCPTWHYHPVDVKTFAAGVLTAKGHTLSFPFYSSEISEALGVQQPEEGKDLHTAMGDTVWTRDIHWAALGHTSS